MDTNTRLQKLETAKQKAWLRDLLDKTSIPCVKKIG